MNNIHHDNINENLQHAISAYKRGDHFNARIWSMRGGLQRSGGQTGSILLAAVSPTDQAINA